MGVAEQYLELLIATCPGLGEEMNHWRTDDRRVTKQHVQLVIAVAACWIVQI